VAGLKNQPSRLAEEKNSGMIRWLYDWISHWLQTSYGVWVLFLVAVAESSFFPIPPDVFHMALSINQPRRAFHYAAVCTAGSVLGGILGYGLGLWFLEGIGQQIIDMYGLTDKYQLVQHLYQKYDAWAVGAAGFTPLPYKLFTITAGAFRISFITFVVVSIIARAGRFTLVAGLIYRYGARIRTFIERYLNLLTVAFLLLLILGFVALKLFF
jgi:membrane protein YqaA with SNARE-associated domain